MPRCALVTGHDLVVVSGATRADDTMRTSFDTRLPSDPCAALDPVSPGSCATRVGGKWSSYHADWWRLLGGGCGRRRRYRCAL
jgi:hypothetical protein